MKVKGREKVRCDRARRFGRGPASVLCSWEVVKQEVQFSANQSLFPSGSFPQKRKLKRVPGKRELPLRFTPFTPILLACVSDHCLLSISLLTPWGAKLPYAWHPHLHRRQNQLEARSGLVYKTGKVLDPLLLWVSNMCTYAYANRKVHLSYVCVSGVLLP